MTDTSKFNRLAKELLPALIQYVPVVDRVHGDHHPEFHEVRRIFTDVYEKTMIAQPGNPDLQKEFARLQEVTQGYSVPTDVCETYEAVYDMLKKLNEAYKF